MDIAPYQDRHRDGVIGLWGDVFAGDPPWNEPGAVIAAKLRERPELFFVASGGGRVLGTVMAGYDGHRGWIYALAVSPDRRLLGIARALMKRAEDALQGLGCVKVNLQVRPDNEGVAAFYEKIGYAVEERISMGKPLGPFAGNS